MKKKKVSIEIPPDCADKLKLLLACSDASTLEEVIIQAIRRHIAERPVEIIEENERLRLIAEHRGIFEKLRKLKERKR